MSNLGAQPRTGVSWLRCIARASSVASIGLERITRKWWFFLLFFFLFAIPSYSSRPIDPRETTQLVTAVIPHALIYSYPAALPLFKVMPILLGIGIALWGDRVTRAFHAYAAATLLLMAVFQNMAVTERYGLAIITGNVVVYALVALCWAWEAIAKETNMGPRKRSWWRYWVVPLALLAFWFPVNTETIKPDWNPLLLLTSEAGVTLCMMVPVYLATLTLYYPRINRVTVRVMAFAGAITGALNVYMWLILNRETAWWMGVLHLPLLLISIYALILSLSKAKGAETVPQKVEERS